MQIRAAVFALLLVAPSLRAADRATVAIGERLFLETRFAEYFAANSGGAVNRPLVAGDPVMDLTVTTGAPLPGPFAGQAMNCRACHLLDEQQDRAGGRTYSDFARRSPVPAREDGLTVTPRNSPGLFGAMVPRRRESFFHFDGEFASGEALVAGTFTGRNFGWLPGEQAAAAAHVARVLREDDGSGDLARSSYRAVLAGDASVPDELRLPKRFRVDVDAVSDDELVAAAARLVAAYLESLTFARTSPYDVFLRRNHLPRRPRAGESPHAYARRLLAAVKRLRRPRFVEGTFAQHAQPFVFGSGELAGLRFFLGNGNCAACHPPPDFTDFRFHNTGVSELEYDEAHGEGAFGALAVPDRATRDAAPEAYLPPSPAHPTASGRFRAIPAAGRPDDADLGLWNVYANPDLADAVQQRRLDRLLCRTAGTKTKRCDSGAQLETTIARFKTPGLRGLVDSGPYLHSGALDTIEQVVEFYATVAARARSGGIRNPDPELLAVQVNRNDVPLIAAFLGSLTEDY